MAAESLENARHASGHISASQLQANMQVQARAPQIDAADELERQRLQQPRRGDGHVTDPSAHHATDHKGRQGVRHGSQPPSIKEHAGQQQLSRTAAVTSKPAQSNAAKRPGGDAACEDNPAGRFQDAAARRIMSADPQTNLRVPSQTTAAGMPRGHAGRHKGHRLQGSQRGRGSRAPSVAGGRSNAAMSLPGNTKRSKVGTLSKQNCKVRCSGVHMLDMK